MARTIDDIASEIKQTFIKSEAMRNAYGFTDYDADGDLVGYYDSKFSAVAIETLMIYIFATVTAFVENTFDWFKEDITKIVDSERYGHKGWYENKSKEFQLGDGLLEDGTYADTTSEEAKAKRIITQAHASSQTGMGVKLKVAKSDSDTLAPLSDIERNAFTEYINRIKPAGMPIEIISSEPDLLAINLVIYYDPLIYLTVADVQNKAKDTINEYLLQLSFNGYFVTTDVVDRLQRVAGFDMIEIHNVKAKYAGFDYVDIENGVRYLPESGYMKLGDDSVQFIRVIANK
jgi:hypothetical protein